MGPFARGGLVLVGLVAAAPSNETLITEDMLARADRVAKVKVETTWMNSVLRRKWSGYGAEWIDLPQKCCDSGSPGIVTYVGGSHQPYIDGAAMLGLSLQRHAPHFPRICMILKTMPRKYKSLLAKAGWTLVEVKKWQPHPNDHFDKNYWWDSYNKINVFRLKLSQVLWLDADAYVWGDEIVDLFDLGRQLTSGQIAMVKDCGGQNFNSGVMLLQPSRMKFGILRSLMVVNDGWYGLDQPVINAEYSGNIVELPPKFNNHGGYALHQPELCETTLVAHYTGLYKPALANRTNLRMVRDGYQMANDGCKNACENLYRKYFCAMKRDVLYLSEELQEALNGISDSGAGCPSRWSETSEFQ